MEELALMQNLIWVLAIGLAGGLLAKLLDLPVLVGYMIGGFVAAFLPIDSVAIHGLSEIGLVLLLFSVGIELSFEKLNKVGPVVALAASIQIILVSLIIAFLNYVFGIDFISGLVLGIGFSLSSTAVVVKLLEDKKQIESIHGRLVVAWLLTQDLFVVPLLALLPVLGHGQTGLLMTAGQSIGSALLVMVIVFFLGKLFAPFVVHTIASTNSRELLVLVSILLATGTAYLVSIFGISAALGAFLAGVVISETQENHAVFAETRPLRDIFVIIFFVTLGFFVDPSVLMSNIFLIVGMTLFVFILKTLIIFFLLYAIGYRGRIAVFSSLGMSQIGEFSFVLFLTAQSMGIIDSNIASIGISVTLLSLIASPFVYGAAGSVWNGLKKLGRKSRLVEKLLKPQNIRVEHLNAESVQKQVVICGYGRVGKWVAKALSTMDVPYIVVDYNQKVVHELKLSGTPVIYGDAAEDEIIANVSLDTARAIVVAIPDKAAQAEIITYCQRHHPDLPIYARAHLDSELHMISKLNVTEVVQPEFEAAISIVKGIMKRSGKKNKEIVTKLSSLRRLHSINA